MKHGKGILINADGRVSKGTWNFDEYMKGQESLKYPNRDKYQRNW